MTAPFPQWPGRETDLAYLQSIMGDDIAVLAQPGLIWQPYMDKCPGLRAFDAGCIRWRASGGVGVAIHGTSVWLAAHYREFAAIAVSHGLRVYAACGMNSDDMLGKARRLGTILTLPECDGVVLDLEGKGEDEKAPAEWSHAMQFVREFADYRLHMRDKLVADQPWPVPTKHWSAFPYEPFAAICDAHAPQYYDEDFTYLKAQNRHDVCEAMFDNSWRVLEDRLASQKLQRVRWITMQGYGHADGERAGLRDYISRSASQPVFVWSEWFPTDLVLAEIAAFTAHGTEAA